MDNEVLKKIEQKLGAIENLLRINLDKVTHLVKESII